tara:strand:- start:365 stop:817 length:453 start_codon:yes stop_codon:yes gene_type:complete
VQKTYLSWQDVHQYCDRLSVRIQSETKRLDNIVGIAKGGLIPATILAKRLGINKVYSIGASSYNGYEKNTDGLKVYQDIPEELHNQINLYVDDIADTGDTFNYLLKERGHDLDRGIYTATIHVKPHTTFRPNFYHKEIENDEWIVYPWEE